MSAPVKLAGFAAVLAVVFGGAAAAGGVIDPKPTTSSASPGAIPAAGSTKAGKPGGPMAMTSPSAGEGDSHAAAGAHGTDAVRGLAVADNGLRVVVENPELRRGRAEQLRFRVVDDHDVTVRDFDVESTKRMHLIVVRRDFTGFQHLHPKQTADGTWTIPLRLDEAGSYRLFADFSHQGKVTTLASDLRVDGSADLRPLPQTHFVATTDRGHRVRLDAHDLRAGQEAELRFTMTRHGRPVRVEPYLGAGGHLVTLREGDLAYLHMHPMTKAPTSRPVRFMATFPSPGRYRLFLQFKDAGRVHTVAFTQEVK